MSKTKRFLARRVPVKSTTFRSVGYTDGARILELEFVSGKVYRYFDVPGY